jgi:Lysylphosphatidylglycerol synthase TM region
MVAYLYATVREKGQGWRDLWQLLQTNLTGEHLLQLTTVVLLTPVNWACESRKWQLLAQKIEKISFTQAFNGVLSGLAMGFIVPNNVGDALGRVMSLQSQQRLSAIGAALLSNGLQFYVSWFFGTIGFIVLVMQHSAMQTGANLTLFILLLTVLFFGIWLIVNRLVAETYLERFRWYRFLSPYSKVIAQYNNAELRHAFLWAVLRYAVFTAQFGLLLYVFGASLTVIEALVGIFLVFFAKTLIPALNFLGDLGVREAASLYFFSFYDIEPARVIATTLTLWSVNILLPVLVGIFSVMRLKLLR